MSADDVRKLKKENSELKGKVLELEKKLEESKAEDCDENCVLCVMVSFCARKPELPHICGRQLEKILIVTVLTREDIDINDSDLVKCSGLMDVLKKCKIINLAKEFEYTSAKETREEEIHRAWKVLMRMDSSEEHVILGRRKEGQLGHAEVCDLAQRADGKVTINDPQKRKIVPDVDEERFREHVIDDLGLELYTVEWKELEDMIYNYTTVLHYARKSKSNPSCSHCSRPERKK